MTILLSVYYSIYCVSTAFSIILYQYYYSAYNDIIIRWYIDTVLIRHSLLPYCILPSLQYWSTLLLMMFFCWLRYYCIRVNLLHLPYCIIPFDDGILIRLHFIIHSDDVVDVFWKYLVFDTLIVVDGNWLIRWFCILQYLLIYCGLLLSLSLLTLFNTMCVYCQWLFYCVIHWLLQ